MRCWLLLFVKLVHFHCVICMLFQIFCMTESKHHYWWQITFDLGVIDKKEAILDFSETSRLIAPYFLDSWSGPSYISKKAVGGGWGWGWVGIGVGWGGGWGVKAIWPPDYYFLFTVWGTGYNAFKEMLRPILPTGNFVIRVGIKTFSCMIGSAEHVYAS